MTIQHTPLLQPRASIPKEGIYLRLWQEFASQRPDEWGRVFRTATTVGQRAASVAASFMVYMGCNAGAAFTMQAECVALLNVLAKADSRLLKMAWNQISKTSLEAA